MDILIVACAVSAVTAVMFLTLRWYVKGGVCRSSARLDGKVVVITGGNTGIGKETAIDLVKRGARVYIACRSLERGHSAAEDIKARSGGDSVYVRHLDLASFRSIRKFARVFQAEERRLDILINNAGLLCSKQKTEDGLEMNFGVNHIGPFLLTNLLLGILKSSAPSRIVNVSSIAHKYAHMDFSDLSSEKNFIPWRAYGVSKLANVLFTQKLARILANSGVSVFSLHPGVIGTELMRNTNEGIPGIIAFIMSIRLFLKTPKEGAQTSIYCAVQPGLEKYSGKYFADCKMADTSIEAQDEGVADKLWEISERICGF